MKTLEIIADLRKRIEWLEKHAEQLDALDAQGITGEFWTNYYDFNRLSHDNVVKVLGAFGPKWRKTVNEASIDYITSYPVDGFNVRCYMGDPPPACKIIEVEEHVPARPASVQKVRKLVCPEGAL